MLRACQRGIGIAMLPDYLVEENGGLVQDGTGENPHILNWPRASWRLVRTALVWRTVEQLLQGELEAPDEQHGLARMPLRALARLGR